MIGAQIVDLYDDGVPKRAREVRIEKGLGWGDVEATSASVTETMVRTECNLVDGSREPGSEIHAACCRRTSRSACTPWSTTDTRKQT